jgi:PIN domain nuclease of toxin-antitoxin system
MAVVTDTHALVHHLTGQQRKLGRRAKTIFYRVERGLETLLIPFTVLEETMLLSEAGKVRLRLPFRELLLSLMQAENYELGENNAELLLEASSLVGIRDPYDRMIVAQARMLGLPLVTGDEEIHASALVRVVWD